ncbi:hypothetical protein HY501_03055, partial [Candidatus Woesearchaeota archaeon]|nr:hypothetical protein [Candidatus Woesearchaeota archaeon]
MVLSRIRDFFERKEKGENIPPVPKLESGVSLPVRAYQENPYRSLAPISVPAQPMYDFLEGKDFYDDSMPKALRKALKYAGPNGIVLTAPEMIAAKAQAGKDHRFNSQLYSVHSEEDLGIDHDGVFLGRGEGIYVIVHGGGLLTPDRIDLAIREGLIYGAAKYTPDEFTGLLHGALPDGTRIPLYALDDIGKSIFNLPHQFGIVAPYRMMRETLSGRHTKEEFLSSPLVK